MTNEAQVQAAQRRYYNPTKSQDWSEVSKIMDQYARKGDLGAWQDWVKENVRYNKGPSARSQVYDYKVDLNNALGFSSSGNRKKAEKLRDAKKRLGMRSFEVRRKNQVGQMLREDAEDFEKRLPQLEGQQVDALRGDIQSNLDEGLKQTRQNYSNRGLLYSGFRQGAEAEKRGEASALLNQGRRDINRDLRSALDARRNVAASYGLKTYEQAVQSAEDAYNVNMQNAIARRKQSSELGSGIGSLVGTYLGSKGSTGYNYNYGGGGSGFGGGSGYQTMVGGI